jgi:hypothetical protein
MVRRSMNASPSARAFRSFVIFFPIPNGLQIVRLCLTTAAPSRSASKSKRSRIRLGIVALLEEFLIAKRDNLTHMATAFVSILVAVNLRVGIVALLDKIINRRVENDNRNRCLIQVINLLGSERIRVRICEIAEKVYESFNMWIRHQFAFRG